LHLVVTKSSYKVTSILLVTSCF